MERLSEGAREIVFKLSGPGNWGRDLHANIIESSVSKAAAPVTMLLRVDEEKGFARLTVRRI